MAAQQHQAPAPAPPPHANGGSNSHHNSSSESEDWGEESWTVDCPCGVTFDDGDEMVECDECGVWVHTSCCQVSKSIATYVCDKCKEKKRKEREESEVAQMLAEELPKSVSFPQNRLGLHLTSPQSCEVPRASKRKVHEHGVPGGDPSIFVGVSSVFSRQLWISTGYVPKLLQVQVQEIPNWQSDERVEPPPSLFELRKPALKESPPLKNSKKLKQDECKVSNEEVQAGFDEDGGRRDRHGKKLEVLRHSKHKYKFRGLSNSQSKRTREDVKEQHHSRKKLKASVDASKSEHRKTSSPKNPKAMKKTAVQEFMDGDLRLCIRCLKPEPIPSEDQGNTSKPFVCSECLRCRMSTRKQDVEGAPPQREDCKKLKSDPTSSSQNLSPKTASTELAKQSVERSQPLDNCDLPSPDGESFDQSPLAKQQQKNGLPAKAPHGGDKPEQKGCQLSVKTTFAKSDIPSPASINSGGPSVRSFGDNASPSSPTNQKASKTSHLPPSASTPKLLVKSAVPSKHTIGNPPVKKSDAKSSNAQLKSSASQPPAKQLTTCKTSLSHTSSKSGHSSLVRKPGSKDPVARDEKGSLFKSNVPSAAGATASAAPLNDEELALLLHQELNSSPRVPRVPRVRQAVSSATGQPSNIFTKRTLGGSSQKEHRLMWRKRYRDDTKESCRGNSSRFSETPLMSNKRHQDQDQKTDDEAASSRADSPEVSEGGAAGDDTHGTPAEENEAGAVSSKKYSTDGEETSEGGAGGEKESSEAAFVSPRQRG